jgi:hypothetical protein
MTTAPGARRVGAADIAIPEPKLDVEAYRAHLNALLKARLDVKEAMTEILRMAWTQGYVARHREETAAMKQAAPGAGTPGAAEMGGFRTPAVSTPS